jgi:hypothetical protein
MVEPRRDQFQNVRQNLENPYLYELVDEGDIGDVVVGDTASVTTALAMVVGVVLASSCVALMIASYLHRCIGHHWRNFSNVFKKSTNKIGSLTPVTVLPLLSVLLLAPQNWDLGLRYL